MSLRNTLLPFSNSLYKIPLLSLCIVYEKVERPRPPDAVLPNQSHLKNRKWTEIRCARWSKRDTQRGCGRKPKTNLWNLINDVSSVCRRNWGMLCAVEKRENSKDQERALSVANGLDVCLSRAMSRIILKSEEWIPEYAVAGQFRANRVDRHADTDSS